VTILPFDVCDPSQVTATVARAEAEHGPLDVLVNNAGIELRSSIEAADEADIRRQFDTNVFGTVRVIQAVLPRMRERQAGTIVNLSSIAGIVSRPFGGFYAASKHAVEAITEALHYEVSPFGIRVLLIEPGQYGTRLLDNAFPGRRFTPASPYWEGSARSPGRAVLPGVALRGARGSLRRARRAPRPRRHPRRPRRGGAADLRRRARR